MSVKLKLNTVLIVGARWLLLTALVSLFAGTLSALFLTALNEVTEYRTQHPYLLYLLPLAGLLVGLTYWFLGRGAERGNNLVFDTIHSPAQVIPFKMAPLVLINTLITHLFGGSAGREGTALQMSAAVADQLHRPFGLSAGERQILLIASLSAGFASVFGTPLAGAVFGIEVLLISETPYKAIIPAFAAAFLGAWVTEFWGVDHTQYHIDVVPVFSMTGLFSTALAGIAFAGAAVLFVWSTDLIAKGFRKISFAPLKPFIGGLVFVGLILLLQTDKYLGLGIPQILKSFQRASDPQDFILKILLTAITLGSGFKGGEVTPLFYIGATLGSALSLFLPLSPGLLAGMGFVAVFAGATKTPIACCLMAFELFGISCGIYIIIACVIAYYVSGSHSIYNIAENRSPKHFLFGKFRKPFL
jgi:H+/Cl- antiporter ClcA